MEQTSQILMRSGRLPDCPAWPYFAPGDTNVLARPATTGGELVSDFKYLTNNALLDAEDIATSPVYVVAPDSPLRTPKFYLVLAGAGAIWGGSYALDQTLRSHLRSMSSSDADLLENVSYGGVSASTALLYGYGLWYGDARARHYALNAGEGAGIATLMNIGIKAAFGRLRPSQSSSHTRFFSWWAIVCLWRRYSDVRAGRRSERIFSQPMVRGGAGLLPGSAGWFWAHGP